LSLSFTPEINNLLDLKRFDEELEELHLKIVQMVKNLGVKHTIRIIPQTLQGRARGLMFDKNSISLGYLSKIVYSVEEAEKLRTKLEKE